MLNKKEVITILLACVILAFSLVLVTTIDIFLKTLLMVFIVVVLNVATKKAMSFYYEADIEIMFWEMSRFGFKPGRHFKKPFPIGAIIPLISKILLFPINSFVWMASLIFDVKPKAQRAAKRHGFYSFYEMTEHEIGIIAGAGILCNLILAVVGYLTNFPDFARINIYYAFFNMLPISNLDGNKVFFGNIVVWSFLASLTVIGLFFALFII